MKVGWSSSHGEFLIEDYYYFSKLRKYARANNIDIIQESSFYRLEKYDVIVFNYPEKTFRIRELGRIRNWIKKGKTVIFTSYYNNIDRVSEIINRVLKKIGSEIRLRYDTVNDDSNNYNDPMFPIGKWKAKEVVMPCTSSISGGESVVSNNGYSLASYEDIGEGRVVVVGTCVFWDNFAIDLLSNREFAISLLTCNI